MRTFLCVGQSVGPEAQPLGTAAQNTALSCYWGKTKDPTIARMPYRGGENTYHGFLFLILYNTLYY